jgi:hypothetical protein
LAKKARVNLAGFGLISDSGLTLFVSGIMNWNIQKGNGVMSILSTREWATLIWECIFLLYVLYHKEIRKSFWNIVVRFQNEICRQKEQADSARKQQTDLDGIGIPEIHNSPDVNVARVGKSITDVTDKSEFVETRETEPVDKVGWIVRKISELSGYENVSDSVKADIFGFDIADVSGSIRLFSNVMKRLEIKLAGDELYEEFQRIYDVSVGRDTNTEKAKDKIWDMRR